MDGKIGPTDMCNATWPSDPNIKRDHLLILDYLPTKFEACWVISHTRYRRSTWPLTYWNEYQYGSSTQQGLSTYQVWSIWGKAFWSYQLHKVWAINMTFDLNINRDHLLRLDYLPTKFEACRTKHCWVISCSRYRRSTDLWPTDLNINMDHLLIKDYLPTKFEDSGSKCSLGWVAIVAPTDRPKLVRNRCVIEVFGGFFVL